MRLLAFLANAVLAVVLVPPMVWLTVTLVAGAGDPDDALVRSGLSLITLLLVATSLSNALFLLKPSSSSTMSDFDFSAAGGLYGWDICRGPSALHDQFRHGCGHVGAG